MVSISMKNSISSRPGSLAAMQDGRSAVTLTEHRQAGRSPARMAQRRFAQDRLAVIGLIILTALILSALLAPLIAPYSPNDIDLSSLHSPPSFAHLLGTDRFGRDVLSRTLYGGRVSLSVAFLAVVIYQIIGLSIGALTGYFGGKVDFVLMRLVDVVMCLPSTMVILLLVAVLGAGFLNVMLAIALLAWIGTARIVRGQYLSEGGKDYVLAARTIGASSARIMFRHILPSVVSPLVVSATFGIASAILVESSLSFLGLGVAYPTATWGALIGEARDLSVLERMPWLWIPPGSVIVLTVLAVSFVGDGLRDALDPRVRID